MLPMAVARPLSGGVAICYVFPVLWMTSYLHILRHMQGCRCNTGTASQPDGTAGILSDDVILYFVRVTLNFISKCLRYDRQNDVRCLRIILRKALGRLSFDRGQSLYLSAGLLSES